MKSIWGARFYGIDDPRVEGAIRVQVSRDGGSGFPAVGSALPRTVCEVKVCLGICGHICATSTGYPS